MSRRVVRPGQRDKPVSGTPGVTVVDAGPDAPGVPVAGPALKGRASIVPVLMQRMRRR